MATLWASKEFVAAVATKCQLMGMTGDIEWFAVTAIDLHR
jgi:hypothetical protein